MKYLWFVYGMSFCFPAFAIINVGNATGVQLTLVLALLLVLNATIHNKVIVMDAPVIHHAFLYFLACVMGFILCTQFSIGINTLVTYSTCIFVMLVPALLRYDGKTMLILKGYEAGCLISVVYAFYQRIGAIFHLPFRALLSNNRSFALMSQQPFFENATRVFGFAPEPSVFAAILLPYFFYVFVSEGDKYKYPKLILTFMAIMFTASFSIVTDFPIALVLFSIMLGQVERVMKLIAAVLAMVVLAAGVYFIPPVRPVLDVALSSVTKRVSAGDEDPSLKIRSAAMWVAIDMALEKPVFGFGFNTADEFIKRMPSDTGFIETKVGVDSLPLTLVSKLGFFGLITCMLLLLTAIWRARVKPELLGCVLCLFVALFTHMAGDAYYFIWGLFGAALGCKNDEALKGADIDGRLQN